MQFCTRTVSTIIYPNSNSFLNSFKPYLKNTYSKQQFVI